MKKYEIGLIVNPTLNQEKIKKTIQDIKDIYEKENSELVDEFDMGVRELAYEIKKFKSGYYYFFVFKASKEANQEFERVCRISEDIIRFMVLDVDNIKSSTLDTVKNKSK